MITQIVSNETPAHTPALHTQRRDALIFAGLCASLLLFYLGSHTIGLPAVLAGLAAFAGLAFLRPRLALLLVPISVPFYLMPAPLAGIHTASGRSVVVPIHEAALVLVVAVWFARGAWRLYAVEAQRHMGVVARGTLSGSPVLFGWRDIPIALFLVGSLLGLATAIVDGPALRELRWLVIEPLVFYGLARFYLAHPRFGRSYAMLLVGALLLGGSTAAMIGILQFAGIDLVPWIGVKQCTCDNIMTYGVARRVSSVYGSPNNLALLLERVWPIASALAVVHLQRRKYSPRSRWYALIFSLVTLVCVLGIVVSFSRGAWLGSVVALGVLAVALLPSRGGLLSRLRSPQMLIGMLLAVALGGAMLMLRNDSLAGGSSVRLLLWQEAVGYLVRNPLGLGLDQFLYYHDPESGRSLIAPALIGTPADSVSHPHNMLLDIWLRISPLGLVAMLWLLVEFFRRGIVYLRTTVGDPLVIGALAAMAGGVVHGLVDQFYFVPDMAIVFWLLIAIVEQRIRVTGR